MNRRSFIKTSAAVAAATAATTVLGPKVFAAANPTYPRSLHFMYPQLLQAQGETYNSLTKALGKVNPAITFLTPLFLNVTDFSSYGNILSYVSGAGIKFGAAVGYPAAGNTLCDGNNGINMSVLEAYDAQGFQPYLRVDNLSGYYQNSGGETDVKNFLTKAINYGFTNIMLNPWPKNPDNNPNLNGNPHYMPITESNLLNNIDSCFQNTDGNWDVIDEDIQNILTQTAGQPSTSQIIINYESPGPQGTIANMTFQNQITTFNTTESSIKTYPAADHLHFALPFTGSYDPLTEKNSSGTTMWDYYMVPLIETWTQGA